MEVADGFFAGDLEAAYAPDIVPLRAAQRSPKFLPSAASVTGAAAGETS